MNRDILISAIVSTYNSEKFIRGKIEDLLNQTIISKTEIIIVNSGSVQNEEKIINEYLNSYPNIKYIRTEERETIYKAWNRGIKIASGKYITNANTDDRLKENAFEILADELDKNPDVALVHADMCVSDVPNQKFDEVSNSKVEIIPEFDYLVQLDRCLVFSQPMWRSSLHYKDNIWFKEDLKICGDHEFEINISQRYKIKHLRIPLGVFYLDKNRSNISHNNMLAVREEKLLITKDYIKKYVDSLNAEDLNHLKNRFVFLTKIPIPILRGINIIRIKLNPHIHRFTHEFVYYFTALLYKKSGNIKTAVNVCRKLLKIRKSDRVEELLAELENLMPKL